MILRDLLASAGTDAEVHGSDEVDVTGLAYDSRTVADGTMFFCVPGHVRDGHEFARTAVEAGATALVVERPVEQDVTQVQVADARRSMAPLASAFWGNPTSELAMAGITGTNGKTTTAFLIRSILEANGRQCGLLGTVEQVVAGHTVEAVRTTPEAIDLQEMFRRMADGGDVACVMEVSSHALFLGRGDAIDFDVAVFTNLTQDHLDFHDDMDDYYAAKRILFERSPRTAVINIDDPYGRKLAAEVSAGLGGGGTKLVTFSAAGAEADLRAESIEFDDTGSRFRAVSAPYGTAVDAATPLPGDFNVSNALAALAACGAMGVPLADAARQLGTAVTAPGRFEPVKEGQDFAVLVDYAHTPDSLDNVLAAARRLTDGRVISVFGCGGDRDRAKRPQMGRIAAERSDIAVVTSDNPRSEDPDAIIADVMEGVADRSAVIVEPDRRKAIAAAFAAAATGDIVVIAGKGHEQGQEFEGGRKLPFDDAGVAREELKAL